jgi:uncharacterized membrane protein
MPDDRRTISLADTIRFLIVTLARWAQNRQWGEVRIVIQNGQIVTVHEARSYQGSLPKRQVGGDLVEEVADRTAKDLATVKG